MVSTDKATHFPSTIDAWIEKIIASYSDKSFATALKKAFSLGLSDEKKESLTQHDFHHRFALPPLRGLAMVEILADLHLDPDTLLVAIVYNSAQLQQLNKDHISAQFNPSIAHLIEGVRKMETLHVMRDQAFDSNRTPVQLENVRKMLLAMAEDVRVVLIKLAEHLCDLRSAKDLDPLQVHKLAQQTQTIYAPLANRLGIGHIKWEMEDLAFRYLEPEAYKKIAGFLHERRVDREQYITHFIDKLQSVLDEEKVDAQVDGRVKHIYSIWRKMDRKNVDYSEIYDVRAVRILVHSIRDCYAALGIVHSTWQHVPKEFDDYIATPKKNGYRSLHTAVVGPLGKIVEIQIRTQDMHQDSELGVAAHWAYKEGKKAGTQLENKMAWLRQLIDTQQEGSDTSDLIAELQSNVLEDRVYVITPRGDVVDLPIGSTPLDFAYQVHTLIGHRCRGAKINGRIVPLVHILQSGEQVDILTTAHPAPSRDWLNPNLGYLKTARARAKVHHWFKQLDRDQHIIDGKALLERELQRLNIHQFDMPSVIKRFDYKEADDVYAALGSGDLRPTQVLSAAKALIKPEPSDEPIIPIVSKKPLKHLSANAITIEGVDNLLTQTARCCKPLPGDPIIGYVTQGRGVSIHRQDCPNILHLNEEKQERLIQVEWGKGQEKTYPVDIFIQAYDRAGLLRDITTLLAAEQVRVLALQTTANTLENTANSTVTLEISDLTQLSRVIEKLNQLPNVMGVNRKR